MKKYLCIISALTLFSTAYAADLSQILTSQQVHTPVADDYVVTSTQQGLMKKSTVGSIADLASFSSLKGQPSENATLSALLDSKVSANDLTTALGGKLSVDNPVATGVVTAPEYDTSSADGEHWYECNNTGAFNITGLTTANAGRFCFDKTLQKFRAWKGAEVVDFGELIGLTPATAVTLSSISDFPSDVTSANVGHLKGSTSPLQAQINALSEQIANLTAAMQSSGVDTTPPVLTRSKPTNLATVSATNELVFNYTASDPGGMDATTPLYYSFNGSANVALTSGVDSATLTAPAPDTPYAWTVTAKNAAGATTVENGTFTYLPSTVTDINVAVKAAGALAGGVINPPDGTNSYYSYSPVLANASGSVSYAHWDMSSNGTNSYSKFMVYDTSGTLVCQSGAVTGTATTPQLVNTALSGCNLTSGVTYFVGVCASADGTTVNSPYLTNSTSGPVTSRVQVSCDGSSFNPTSAASMSTTRPIFAWGDNSATR